MEKKKEKKSIFERFKLNTHTAFERFFRTFLISTLALIFVIIYCFRANVNERSSLFQNVAVYSDSFQSSRTSTEGNLVDVYANDDNTRAFALLKFSDPTKISTNAKNYRMFMTPSYISKNPKKINGNPVGGLYVFGNTGYVGVYLVNSAGFDYQILDLTMRLSAELSEENAGDIGDINDESFKEFDQFTFRINPGAKGAKKLKALNTEDAPNVVNLYNEIVSIEREKDSHIALSKSLDNMRLSLNRIEEYSERLDTIDRVQVPELNPLIAGDSIKKETLEKDEKEDTKDTKEKESLEKSDDSERSKALETLANTNYIYTFKNSFKGSYDVDWQNDSVLEKDIIKENMMRDGVTNLNTDQYLSYKKKEQALNTDMQKAISNDMWTLKDGTNVDDLDIAEDSTRYQSIRSDIDNYENACREYLMEKENYQTKLLQTLLSIQSDAQLVEESASVNVDKDFLLIY